MNRVFPQGVKLDHLIIFFFALVSVFPAMRVLLVGVETASSLQSIIITILPDILAFVILIIGLIRYIKKPFSRATFDYFIIGYILTNVILGIVLGRDLKIAAYGFRYTYLPVLFYFVGRTYSTFEFSCTTGLIKNIFNWFTILSVLSLIKYFFFPSFEINLIEKLGYQRGEYFISRMSSMVLTPILFATMIAIALVYFLFQMYEKIGWWNVLSFTLLSACLALTASRGAILAFLIVFVITSLVVRKWKGTLAALASLTFVVLALGLVLPGSGNFFMWMFASAGDTMAMGDNISRVELWKRSWQDFTERPWGYGLGKAGVTAVRFFQNDPDNAAIYTTDGWYLKMACETGIYGVVSYLVMASVFLFSGLKKFLANRNLVLGFFVAVFLFVNIQNVVSNVLDFFPFISLIWLLVGLGQNMILNGKQPLSR